MKRLNVRAALAASLLGAALLPTQGLAQEPTFRTSTPVVLVPVTVTGRGNKFVEGLQPGDFKLMADGKTQEFRLDVAESVSAPLAIVFLVQINDSSEATNQKVRKVGGMIQPLITGNRGRAAVVGFGEHPVILSDFTHDEDALRAAFEKTAASQGGHISRQIDAVVFAAKMLAARPRGERKVLILLGESRDRGSWTPLGEALKLIQQEAITVFAATWSPFKTAFTNNENRQAGQRGVAAPPPLPSPPNPLATPGPPNTSSNIDILAGVGEVARLTTEDSARIMVEMTGGEKLGFSTLQGLENALTRLGEELHGQYLLSFPATGAKAGYHTLEVQVQNRRGLKIRTRDGFWVGEKATDQP
jgi:VWFA-related protein